jgi:hypothetical protein
MGFLTLFSSLLLAATQPPAEDPGHWRCRHEFEREQGVVMITRWLDVGGQYLYDYVGWVPRRRFGTSSAGWERLDSRASAPWALKTDSVVAMLNLTRPAQRPVWLVLKVDGRIAGRRLLFRQTSELPDYDRQTLELWVDFTSHPPEAGRTPDLLPDLADAGEAVLSAEEEGGETLASYSISLPGRALIEWAVAEAAPALDAAAADYRTQCQEEGQPPRMSAMPPPG